MITLSSSSNSYHSYFQYVNMKYLTQFLEKNSALYKYVGFTDYFTLAPIRPKKYSREPRRIYAFLLRQ